MTEELVAVQRADVYTGGQLAATLTRIPEGVSLSYTAEWVKNAGRPVATTLPVTATPVVTAGGAVPAYFAGLLPEGRRLSALRRTVKTSADDVDRLLPAVVQAHGWHPRDNGISSSNTATVRTRWATRARVHCLRQVTGINSSNEI